MIERIARYLTDEKSLLVTAESCTGGWIAKTITDLAGSSKWFDRGFITYSNTSKVEMLGVNPSVLDEYGAVSEQVAVQMSLGAIKNSQADYSMSVTGIAGPGGGSAEKPVGMVCFGWAKKGGLEFVETKLFSGNRDEIRYQSVDYALNGLIKYYLTQN